MSQVSKPRGGSDRPRRHGDDAGAAAQDLWQRLQSMYQVVVKSRAVRKPAPHELDPKAAAQALIASVRGLIKAATSPYVIDKLIKSGTPILVTLLVVYLLGRLLLVPIQAAAIVVGAVVPGASRQGASDWGTAALHDMVASTSLLLMLGLRKWLHKPIFKCFIHTLRDVNPPLAQQIEVTPVLPRARSRGPQQEQQKPLGYKVARLLALSLLASWGRRTPILGWFVAPVMLFKSGERLLGTERALLLAALGLVPAVAPWALGFLQLWRSSHVTGSELLDDYVQHSIPGAYRDAWFRRNEVAVFGFLAPMLLLMKIPIVGPLLFLPASAAAAYLADFLHRQPDNAPFIAGAAGGQPGAGAAPSPSSAAGGDAWQAPLLKQRHQGSQPATRPMQGPFDQGSPELKTH
jgi:hypothetical protein